MKPSKSEVRSRVQSLPEIRFEDQRLTPYSGLVIVQAVLERLQLRERLRS